MPNVSLYLESDMTAETVAELGADHVLVATGATWRRDGTGSAQVRPIALAADAEVLTPDDIMAGRMPRGRDVLIYDDDHYYMGGVLAELLRKHGFSVTLVTPAPLVSIFTKATLEQATIQSRLLELDVRIEANTLVKSIAADRYGIGYSGIGYRNDTVAVVPLGSKSATEVYPPEMQYAYSGEYPLSRFLYLAVNPARSALGPQAVRDFIQFIYSDDGQRLVTKDGFFPVSSKIISEDKAKLGI